MCLKSHYINKIPESLPDRVWRNRETWDLSLQQYSSLGVPES